MNNPEAIVTVDGIQIYTTKEELKEAVKWAKDATKELDPSGGYGDPTKTIQDFYRYKYLSNK